MFCCNGTCGLWSKQILVVWYLLSKDALQINNGDHSHFKTVDFLPLAVIALFFILLQAVCCPDNRHCCPSRTRCDLTRQACISGVVAVPWYEKTQAVSLDNYNPIGTCML